MIGKMVKTRSFPDELFHELFAQCENADKLTDRLRSELEKLNETERQQLVTRTKDKFTPLFLSANRGILDTVQYLLAKCNAEVNQFCIRNGETNDMLKITALMEAQNVDVARCLLEHGAEYTSTALRLHICSLRLEVADFLFSQGADINDVPTNESKTLRNNIHNNPEMHELFLKFGANVNVQNELQETPLHIAVKQGKLWKVEQLLKYGADPKLKTKMGDDALRLTCRHGHDDIFKHLMDNVKYSDVTRANAHELMGAVYIANEETCSNSLTTKHWKAALSIRHNNGGQFLERELNEEPLIKNVHEFRSKDDLDGIVNSSRALIYQSLLINHRILGYDDKTTFNALYNVFHVYSVDSKFKLAFYFIMRIVYLLLDSNGIVHSFTRESALKAALVILHIVDIDGIERVGVYFDDFLTIVVILWAQLVDPTIEVSVYEIILALLGLLAKMPKNKGQIKLLRTFVTAMVKKSYCSFNGRSLLHVAASIKKSHYFKYTGPLVYFSKPILWAIHRLPVVQLLLECGHDVDALDNSGSSPLHLAANNKGDLDMVNCLLEYGAHIDRSNAENVRPCHLLDAVPGFNTFDHVTLKCLAARIIAGHKVPCKHLEFTVLSAFISMH